jgi:hypothetical protein
MRPRIAWLWFVFLLPPLVLANPRFEAKAHAIHGNDGFLNYAYAHSLLVGQDLNFTDDYRLFDLHFARPRDYDFRFQDTPLDPVTGRPVNRYGWGSALLWSPLLVPAQVIGELWQSALQPFEGRFDAFSEFHFLAVRLGTALWAVLGLAALAAVARRHLLPATDRGLFVAAMTALGLVVCTNLVFYIYLHPSMSTGPAFGLAGILIWQIHRLADRRSPGRWFALGLTMGLLICTRYGDIGLALGLMPALWAADRQARRREPGLDRPIAILGFFAGLAPVVLVQMSPLSGPAPYLGPDYQWEFPGRHSLAVLVSFHHGWITWHPAVLVGLIGLVVMTRDSSLPLWLRLTPLAVVAQLLAVGAWPEWTGGASFGGRLMATALSVVFLGLVVALRWMGERWGLRWAVAMVVLLALWNLDLLAQYALEMIPRQGPVSPLEVWRNSWELVVAPPSA